MPLWRPTKKIEGTLFTLEKLPPDEESEANNYAWRSEQGRFVDLDYDELNDPTIRAYIEQ